MIRKDAFMNKEKIKEILIQINDDIKEYKGNNFFDDGLLDSLNFVDLVAEIGDTFNIEIPTKYLKPDYFKNIDAIDKLISEILNNK